MSVHTKPFLEQSISIVFNAHLDNNIKVRAPYFQVISVGSECNPSMGFLYYFDLSQIENSVKNH